MTNTTRQELINLYKSSLSTATKVKRNADKLAFMSMSKNNMFAFETYGDQLAAYEADAKKARDAFAKAAFTLSAQEVVSIITEATA